MTRGSLARLLRAPWNATRVSKPCCCWSGLEQTSTPVSAHGWGEIRIATSLARVRDESTMPRPRRGAYSRIWFWPRQSFLPARTARSPKSAAVFRVWSRFEVQCSVGSRLGCRVWCFGFCVDKGLVGARGRYLGWPLRRGFGKAGGVRQLVRRSLARTRSQTGDPHHGDVVRPVSHGHALLWLSQSALGHSRGRPHRGFRGHDFPAGLPLNTRL